VRDVLLQGSGRLVDPAGDEGVQDLLVVVERGRDAPRVRTVAHLEQAVLAAQGRQEADQPPVARGVDQQVVQAQVAAQEERDRLLGQPGTDLMEQLELGAQLGGVERGRGQPQGQGLQRPAQIVDLVDVLDGERARPEAPARVDAHEAVPGQTVQGLSHGGAANAKLRGERRVGEAVLTARAIDHQDFPDFLIGVVDRGGHGAMVALQEQVEHLVVERRVQALARRGEGRLYRHRHGHHHSTLAHRPAPRCR